VDGEGHIGIRWGQISSGLWSMQPGLSLHSTDRAVLYWVAELTGVGRVRYTLNKSPLARKEQYKWQVSRLVHILLVLRQIAPYMHIKWEMAHRMIEELESYQGPQLRPGYSTVVQVKQVAVPFRGGRGSTYV
jgi:hypothetical protein